MFRNFIKIMVLTACTATTVACDGVDDPTELAAVDELNDVVEDLEAPEEVEPVDSDKGEASSDESDPSTLDISNGPRVVRGTCGQVFHPTVSGGEAMWTLSCGGGNITMAGWVKDTSWDNKCAYAQGNFNNNIVKLTAACNKGTTTYFNWTYPGTLANGYLMVK